jgi:hypothetical protein
MYNINSCALGGKGLKVSMNYIGRCDRVSRIMRTTPRAPRCMKYSKAENENRTTFRNRAGLNLMIKINQLHK